MLPVVTAYVAARGAAWIEISLHRYASGDTKSRLAEPRGLKSVTRKRTTRSTTVAARGAAWIEIEPAEQSNRSYGVAARGAAWIEILNVLDPDIVFEVAARGAAWIEIPTGLEEAKR